MATNPAPVEAGPNGNRRQAAATRQIVPRLTADYPPLAGKPRWSRRVQITAAVVVGGLTWALLSVAMVAWGWRGIVLTCASVATAGSAAAWEAGRQHR